MKHFVEVPGTMVEGCRLLRPVPAPNTSVPQVRQQARLSNEQPDLSALGQMYDKLKEQATDFVRYNRPCPSQGSFQREPFGVKRKR